MKNTLFKKIFIVIFVTIFIILSISFYFFITSQKKSTEKSLELKAQSIAQSFVIANTDAMIIDNEIKVLEFAQDFVGSISEIKSFKIVRNKGNVLLFTKDSWSLLEEDASKHKAITSNSHKITYSPIAKEEVFQYNYAIYFAKVYWGNFSIELSLKDYKKEISNIFNNAVMVIIAFLITSILISYIIAKMISKPVVELTQVSKQIADGNLTKRAVVSSGDEIELLAQNFNHMVQTLDIYQKRLKESHDELEQRVELRTLELKELNDTLELKVQQGIKKQQEQEQLLIQQSKLASMGEMIGNIAHQWRQPLNALGLVMQNIQFAYEMDELDNEFMEKSVNKVNLLTTNMSKTIDDFRNFFKPNKSREVFLLNTLVEKTLELVESTFSHNSIALQSNIKDTIEVYGFENEYSQTLLNIVNNAKDALLETQTKEAKVIIEVSKDDEYGIVTVTDNAGGIPEDIIKKIFDPYFTTKEEGKGTGIGLYMSKIIIENNMKGKLNVQNSDIGAKFTVKIPLYKEL